ncbi:MAG: hypothetical protein LBR80_12330 [Deltaproteobacteria bacterium]|jgi:hypothetical protein|nr:hypothetical protein [Deltaproteobacteria bacterium]
MSEPKRGVGPGRLGVRGTRMVETVKCLKVLDANIRRVNRYVFERKLTSKVSRGSGGGTFTASRTCRPVRNLKIGR